MFLSAPNTVSLSAGGTLIGRFSPAGLHMDYPVRIGGGRTTPVTGNSDPHIYRTTSGGASWPFTQQGNLVIQARSNALQHITFMTGTTPAQRLTILADGTVKVEAGAKLEVVDTLIIPVK